MSHNDEMSFAQYYESRMNVGVVQRLRLWVLRRLLRQAFACDVMSTCAVIGAVAGPLQIFSGPKQDPGGGFRQGGVGE